MKSGVTLQQMLTEVKRQSESKEDYLIAPNRLRMESYGKEMFLHLSDDSGTELIEPMTITGMHYCIPKPSLEINSVTATAKIAEVTLYAIGSLKNSNRHAESITIANLNFTSLRTATSSSAFK